MLCWWHLCHLLTLEMSAELTNVGLPTTDGQPIGSFGSSGPQGHLPVYLYYLNLYWCGLLGGLTL